MSNGVLVKPVWLSLALVVAFSLVTPGIATRAAANELQQSESASVLVQSSDVLRVDNLSQVSYAEASESDSESDSCSSCGKCCCRRPNRVFFAGTEATFLYPSFSGSAMTSTVNNVGAGTTTVYSDDVTALDQRCAAGPRVWLGVQGERWGLVTRFWELNDSRLAFDPLTGIAPTGLQAASRFEAYTLDLELTRRFCRGNSKIDFAVGVRHASIENDSILDTNELVGVNLLSTSALTAQQFDGTGITIGLEGRRPIRQSNFCLFWKLRGSLLWGDVTNNAVTSASYSGVAGTAYAFDDHVVSTSDDLFIGEVQLGLQYERELRCLPATAFFRVAAEYQGWDANGGAVGSTSTVFVGGLASGAAQATSSDVRTNLVGFTLGTGLSW